MAVEIVLKNAENVVVVGNGVFEHLVSCRFVESLDGSVAIGPVGDISSSEPFSRCSPVGSSIIPGRKVSNLALARVSAHQVRSSVNGCIDISNVLSSFNKHFCFPATFSVFVGNLFGGCGTEFCNIFVRNHVHSSGDEGHDEGQKEKGKLEDLEKADAQFLSLAFLSAALDGQSTHNEHVDSEDVDESFEQKAGTGSIGSEFSLSVRHTVIIFICSDEISEP